MNRTDKGRAPTSPPAFGSANQYSPNIAQSLMFDQWLSVLYWSHGSVDQVWIFSML